VSLWKFGHWREELAQRSPKGPPPTPKAWEDAKRFRGGATKERRELLSARAELRPLSQSAGNWEPRGSRNGEEAPADEEEGSSLSSRRKRITLITFRGKARGDATYPRGGEGLNAIEEKWSSNYGRSSERGKRLGCSRAITKFRETAGGGKGRGRSTVGEHKERGFLLC